MDQRFGDWLAGFIDGEGSFSVHKSMGGRFFSCRFTLRLRADDRAILDDIVLQTGIGSIYAAKPTKIGHPVVIWNVVRKGDCLALVELLDQHPLRAKKARDYAVWREAVIYWLQMPRGNRYSGPRDWSQMIAYKEAIEQARAYS